MALISNSFFIRNSNDNRLTFEDTDKIRNVTYTFEVKQILFVIIKQLKITNQYPMIYS